jgi:hypothetical protein
MPFRKRFHKSIRSCHEDCQQILKKAPGPIRRYIRRLLRLKTLKTQPPHPCSNKDEAVKLGERVESLSHFS